MDRRSPKSHMVKMKMPMAKSPVAKSPMPKSPMPKSPIPRSPVACEKYKSRCAYGLISFFSFRHCHSKKMISDTYSRSLSRHYLDDQPRHSDQYNIHDVMDGKNETVDYSKAKVKKIKSGMSTEQQSNKKNATAKVENVQSDSEHAQDQSTRHRKAAKSSRRCRRLPIYGCYDVSTAQYANSTLQIVAERSLNSLDSQGTVEVHPDCKCEKECNSNSKEINLQVNLNEATKAFINQKLIDGRHINSDGSSRESKHFLDALEVLNSNKDLFVKLLQDPNSVLVKHIEDLRYSQEKEQKDPLPMEFELLENQIGSHPKDGECQPLENIELSKPQLNSLYHCADTSSPESPQFWNMQQSVKPAVFSFVQMKRKLMRVIEVRRKKQQHFLSASASQIKSTNGVRVSEKCAEGNVEDMVSRFSPDKEASDLGKLATCSMDSKRKTQMDKEESDPGVIDEAGLDCGRGLESLCLSPSWSPKTEKHDLYAKPRMDISELDNGNTTLQRMQRVKTWHGIGCVPDYDYLPMISPRRTKGNRSVSSQRRFPPYETLQIAREKRSKNQEDKKGSCSSPRHSVEASPHEDVLDNLYLDVGENKSTFSFNISFSELETSIDKDLERISSSEMTSEIDSFHDDGVNQSSEMVDTCEESPSSPSPIMTQTSNRSLHDYSSSPSNSCSLKEFDVIKDNIEQPSPIPVLDDQFFIENANLGTEEVCLAAHQSEVAAKIGSVTSIEEFGSILTYMGEVLQASHFTWDGLSQKFQISDQILDLSLFEDFKVGSTNRRLLFDYVKEVVLDAYSCHSSCSCWLSFIKPDIVPAISTSGNMVHEIMKHVDGELLLAQNPKALEKIIEMDLSKSTRWMDIRLDAEDTVCEIIDQLVEELTVEFVIQY